MNQPSPGSCNRKKLCLRYATMYHCNTQKHYICTIQIQNEIDMITRSGEMVSAQVGIMGAVTGLASGDFSLADGQPFNIKNDGISPVELEVQLAGMPDGTTIITKFDCGWNPEIVRVIKATSLSSINLKFGY